MAPNEKVLRLLAKARPAPSVQPKPYTRIDKSLELYRETGENFRSVRVQISGDHFQIDTHDMGKATEEFWGDSDYEFWAVVQREHWPELLAALARHAGAEAWATDPQTWRRLGDTELAKLLLKVSKAMFAGESRATDLVKDICAEHGVKYSGGSWV
jgi:hypothetical protein